MPADMNFARFQNITEMRDPDLLSQTVPSVAYEDYRVLCLPPDELIGSDPLKSLDVCPHLL